ncbi:hypothetical protein LAJ58_11265, partial [Streptococcus pneumoniae]|nr:hypothetical protein [Streptococcus pneumoniae]
EQLHIMTIVHSDIQRNNSPLTCDNRLSLHSVAFLFTSVTSIITVSSELRGVLEIVTPPLNKSYFNPLAPTD